MKTTTRVHTPEERREMRQKGDRLARVCQIRLLCVVSILRTAITRVIPLGGSASWWIVPLCLLPWIGLYVLLAGVMRRNGAPTLMEAVRAALGRAGVWTASFLLGLLLFLDSAASMTALVTLFTEGIGTEGTQITMAALTLLAILFCLHRDGLPWGIYLLRRGLLLMLAVIGGVMLTMARADALHPVLGQGGRSVMAALKAGAAMGWPLLLLLSVENPQSSRLSFLPPAGIAAGAVLLVCLTYPCEVLEQSGGLAQRLLLGTVHLPPALRTLAHGLGMLGMLLAVATAAQLSSGMWLTPSGREVKWLSYGIAAVLAGSQCLQIAVLWRSVNARIGYLAVLLPVLTILMILRRKSCSDG